MDMNKEYTRARANLMKRIRRLEQSGRVKFDRALLPVRPEKITQQDIDTLNGFTRQKLEKMSGVKNAASPSTPVVKSDLQREYNAAIRRLSKNSRVKISDLKKVITPDVFVKSDFRSMTTAELRQSFPELVKSGKLKPVKVKTPSVTGKRKPPSGKKKRKPVQGAKKRKSGQGEEKPAKQTTGKKRNNGRMTIPDIVNLIYDNRTDVMGELPLSLMGQKITKKRIREWVKDMDPKERQQMAQKIRKVVEESEYDWIDMQSGQKVKSPEPGRNYVNEKTGELYQGNPEAMHTIPDILNLYRERLNELLARQSVATYTDAVKEIISSFEYIVAREGDNIGKYLEEHGKDLLDEISGFVPAWVLYRIDEIMSMENSDGLFTFIVGSYEIDF